MPYQMKKKKPEVAVEVDGKKVYHTYRDNDFDQRDDFCFTTDPEDTNFKEPGIAVFDIDTLPGFDPKKMKSMVHKRAVLRKAIENGIL